ncbi:MAG: M14 family metallocarboxypeptidase [Proteobacteria bacterium]|nr:M14 family metallocarboxypeptidase [Pseudomonadota bacterium]
MTAAHKFPDMTPEETHNTPFFYKRLAEAFEKAKRHCAYDIESLGKLGEFDLFFCAPKKIDPAKKNILISGGFHGEEPAGSWGIVHFLETATAEELNSANLFFMPLVNPTGFNVNRRHNDWDEDPNQGFSGADGKKPSREGQILVDHLDRLLKAAADGFLTLHEDSDMKQSYLWTYEDASKPGPVTDGLLKVLGEHFPIFSGDMPNRGVVVDIKDGIGFNVFDNSFESMLVKLGVPYSATPETPAHPDMPIGERVRCQRDVIAAFVKLRK